MKWSSFDTATTNKELTFMPKIDRQALFAAMSVYAEVGE